MLDTLRQVETPEGIELSLPVAGPVVRARAAFADLLIKLALLWLGAIVLAILGAAGAGLYLVFTFLLTWLYSVVFEVLRGATPGKQMLGLRVVHDDGMPIGWAAALIRSLVGFVDMLPFGYAVGLASTLLNPDSKRLGDMAAGTLVIHQHAAPLRELHLAVPPSRPTFLLDVDEQRGLVELAARAGSLTAGRLEELARIPSALTTGGPDVVRQLMGQARWIRGDR